MNLEPCIPPCIPPGEICLPCMYKFESDLQIKPNEVEYQLKVFEVKKHLVHQGEHMHEHIVYELR